LIGLGTVIDVNSTTNTRVYNAIEETFTGRIGKGQFYGGVTTQRQVSNTCQASTMTGASTPTVGWFQAASDPNFTGNFCNQALYHIPFKTMFKVSGTYNLPKGFIVGGTFQSYPGTTNYGLLFTNQNWTNVLYSSSAVAPYLTPNQAAETYVQLIEPGSKYLPRLNQLDVRVTRSFKLGERWGVLQPQMDIFNLNNCHAVVAQTTLYGAKLTAPTSWLPSRLVSFGLQYHF